MKTSQYHFQIVAVGISFLLLFFLACKNELKEEASPLRLTEAQMIRLLKDVQLAEASLNFQRNLGKNTEDQKDLYFDLVFKQNGLTPAILEENLVFYNRTPENLERIYDSVIVSLKREQDSLKLDNKPD